MGGGVLALLQMPLSHSGTQPDCDGGGNLLLTVVFSLQLYSRIDDISPLVSCLSFEAAFISTDMNQAGVSTC